MYTAFIRGDSGPWKKAERGVIESPVLDGSAHSTIHMFKDTSCVDEVVRVVISPF